MTSVLSPLVCSPSLSPVAELGFAPDTSLCMAEELRAQIGGRRGQVKGLQLLPHREPGCSSGCEMDPKTSNQGGAPVDSG